MFFGKILFFFLKNYLAKSEIEGLTEGKKISYTNFKCASRYLLNFEKNMALERVQFLKFCQFLESYSFFNNEPADSEVGSSLKQTSCLDFPGII